MILFWNKIVQHIDCRGGCRSSGTIEKRKTCFARLQRANTFITKTSTGKIVTENNQKHIPNVAWFSIFLGKKNESLYRKKSVITGKNIWTFPESYPTGKIVTEKNQKHIPNVAWFSIFLGKQYESFV
jgi:hypothetical protein